MAYLHITFFLFSFPEFIRKGGEPVMIKRGKGGGFATFHLFFLLAKYQSKCCFGKFLSLFYRATLRGAGHKYTWRSDIFFPVLWLEFSSWCVMFCFKCRTVLVIPLDIFVAFLSRFRFIVAECTEPWLGGRSKEGLESLFCAVFFG